MEGSLLFFLRLALAVETGPLTRLDETGPVERVGLSHTVHCDLCMAQRVATPETGPRPPCKSRHHRFPGDVVADWPETHHHGFGAPPGRTRDRSP